MVPRWVSKSLTAELLHCFHVFSISFFPCAFDARQKYQHYLSLFLIIYGEWMPPQRRMDSSAIRQEPAILQAPGSSTCDEHHNHSTHSHSMRPPKRVTHSDCEIPGISRVLVVMEAVTSTGRQGSLGRARTFIQEADLSPIHFERIRPFSSTLKYFPVLRYPKENARH